jgi:hypothetical protein
VSELVAIWLAGAAVLLLVGLIAAVFLRFTRVGREQELTLGDVVKVLVVCIALSCAIYTVLSITV